MKSRFLTSITVALTLLLGLAASNLMAQITATSSVDFLIQPYDINGTAIGAGLIDQTSGNGQDTVGHKFGLTVRFEAVAQELAQGVSMDFTLPTGTVVDETLLKDGTGVQIYYSYWNGTTTLQSQYYVDPSNITIATANPLASVNDDVRPVIRIKETTTFTTERTVEVRFLKGLYHGRSVLKTNDADLLDDKQGNMYFKFVHGSSVVNAGTYYDSTSFYVQNDLANGVAANSSISSVISDGTLSENDSIMIIDRFGNFVPNFMAANAGTPVREDTIMIYTTAGLGDFTATPELAGSATGWAASTAASLFGAGATTSFIDSTVENKDTLYILGANANNTNTLIDLANFRGATDPAYGAGNTAKLLSNVIGNGTTANADSSVTLLYLGAKGHSGKVPGLGLKFTPLSGVTSLPLNIELKGSRKATGTLLGVAATNKTTLTRTILDNAASKQIGTITLALTGGAGGEITNRTNRRSLVRFNGAQNFGTITMTVKDKFGGSFTGSKAFDGTNIERVAITIKGVNLTYNSDGNVTGVAENADLTNEIINGKTIGGYTRGKTHLYHASITRKDGSVADSLATSVTVTAASTGLTNPVYLGTTCHDPSMTKAIAIIASAPLGGAADTLLIAVEPSLLRAFDVTGVQDTLNKYGVIRGAAINAPMPIFALDTAYNYLSTLDLITASTNLSTVTPKNNGLVAIKGLLFLIDGTDVGNTNVNQTAFITIDSSNVIKGLISNLDGATTFRADSSRLNLGGVGLNKLGLKVDTTGIRRLSIRWKPATTASATGAGTAGIFAYTPDEKTQDLALFNLQSSSLIDSVTNLNAAGYTTNGDTAGGVVSRIINFKALAGNILNPDKSGDTSRIFIKFLDLTAGAGLPATLTASNFKVAVDTMTWYNALEVGGDNDSVAIKVPMLVDPSSGNGVFVKVMNFTNPTKSDSTYRVSVATGMNPVWSTTSNAAGYTPGDGTYNKFKILNVRTPLTGNPKYFDVVAAQSDTTLRSGTEAMFKLLLGDKFGNVVTLTKAGTTPDGLIITSTTTNSGNSLSAFQKHDGTNQPSHGSAKMDSIRVNLDSLPGQNRWPVVDSISVTPATAGVYYLVFADSANASIKDSIKVTVEGTSVTGTISIVSKPDSLVADTTNAQSVVVKVKDGDGVKKVKLAVSTFTLTLGTDNKFTKSATSVDEVIWDSTMKATHPDSTNVTFSIPKKAIGSLVEYVATVYDMNDETTATSTQNYTVGSKRGKSKLSTDAVNVADIMRLVYLVLGYATPNVVDYFGLDLNQDGAFTGDADLVTILNIWKGTATLASSTEQQERTAKAALSFKEIDKTNASLSINLENRGELNYAEFQVKYDATKYSFGEVSRTERIDQNVQVVFNNRKEEGILHIVVINLQGRSIASGSGAVLTVPVQALNGKFDGTGEISLLSAGFEQNVKSELSKEVLSPKAALPKAFALGQNYPNPFNPSTTIAYDIPEGKEVQVRLNIYNVRGQLVRTLVDEVKSEGAYQIQWDGSSNNGQKVSSGVYFYRLVAGEFNQTRKMVILK